MFQGKDKVESLCGSEPGAAGHAMPMMFVRHVEQFAYLSCLRCTLQQVRLRVQVLARTQPPSFNLTV